ncbi:zinc ribbon domain-containing protein [Streptomyces avermitilis]|uniref:zinc ribbon domain-containing protein n=1 Tax=Streptomyces avermitilis TaxID=33903 RepID=UPI0037237C60
MAGPTASWRSSSERTGTSTRQCCSPGDGAVVRNKRNRVDQGLFICRGCGVVAHADRNASHNIATRGESVWNAGRESRVPATP